MAISSRAVRLEPEIEKALIRSELPFSGLVNRLLKDFFNVKTEKDEKARRLEAMIQKKMYSGGSE